MAKKRGLGKGVDALFGADETQSDSIVNDINFINEKKGEKITLLRLSQVIPNKEQPRKNFDTEKLQKLAESIKQHGVIQPIIVKENRDGFYMIVAGERRWRAARMASLKEIPAIVRTYDELSTMQIALIENLQRENLDPIEEAASYRALLDDFSLTQEEISERVGKSRSAIANSVRLLTLPEEIRHMLSEGKISEGHARAILSLDDDEAKLLLAKNIAENSLSVRQAEQIAKTFSPKKPEPKKKPTPLNQFDVQIGEIQKKMSDVLGTKVKILNGAKKGKIEIEYYSPKDLDRLLKLLNM